MLLIMMVGHPSNINRRKNIIVVPYNEKLKNINYEFRHTGIKIVFHFPNNIKNKLTVNKYIRNSNKKGVYMIPCSKCPLNYIGQTGRDLKQRIQEHKKDIRMGLTSSSIFNHVQNYNHTMNWEGSKFLYCSEDHTKRLIVESVAIDHFPNFNMSLGNFRLSPPLQRLVISAVEKNN